MNFNILLFHMNWFNNCIAVITRMCLKVTFNSACMNHTLDFNEVGGTNRSPSMGGHSTDNYNSPSMFLSVNTLVWLKCGNYSCLILCYMQWFRASMRFKLFKDRNFSVQGGIRRNLGNTYMEITFCVSLYMFMALVWVGGIGLRRSNISCVNFLWAMTDKGCVVRLEQHWRIKGVLYG